MFPCAIQLESDESGSYLWAVFVDDIGTCRVSLLYGSREERLNAQAAATLAAFATTAEATAQVGNNGSGGRI
jgi:hypothetical protein